MIYDTDIKEIVAFINAAELYENDNVTEKCISSMTEKTGEAFLDERAEKLSMLRDDEEIRSALKKLSSICNDLCTKCDECPVSKYCNHFIMDARKKVDKSSFTMVDLFCGAGGLSLGFTQEGFVTRLANDIQECCVDTYAHNHPETPRNRIILGDIKEVADNLESIMHGDKPSIVVGGPPCQGFSEANRQRLIDDPRNYLYKSFVAVVQKLQPPFFVMENVKGMLKVKAQVIEDFNKIGYEAEAYVLNAKDFGVPQNRERLIYIGNRVGVDNKQVFSDIFELSKSISGYTLGDALAGLRELQASRIKNSTELDTEESGYKIERNRCSETNDYITYINQGRTCKITCNHKARYNNDRDIEIYGRMNPGDKSDDPKIADIMPYKSRNHIFKDKYYKLEADKVCKTITAHMKFDCNMYIHPAQARGLTPREAARVQSYPDDYFFRGSYTKTFMQIGNSVPPLLGRVIAKAVKKYLEQEKADKH